MSPVRWAVCGAAVIAAFLADRLRPPAQITGYSSEDFYRNEQD